LVLFGSRSIPAHKTSSNKINAISPSPNDLVRRGCVVAQTRCNGHTRKDEMMAGSNKPSESMLGHTPPRYEDGRRIRCGPEPPSKFYCRTLFYRRYERDRIQWVIHTRESRDIEAAAASRAIFSAFKNPLSYSWNQQ
jgi:hypothetical protein